MIPYQKQKIENAICYFAEQHRKRTKKYLYQTFLYKYLAFLDFFSIEETGMPALGLKYAALKKGPVPIEIYNARKDLVGSCFKFVKDSNIPGDSYRVITTGKPDLDYFSEFEIGLMNRILEIYAQTYIGTDDIIEGSHETIKAWQKAYKKEPNSEIDYKDQFDPNILSKPLEKLTAEEENFVNYLIFESI